MVLPFVEVAGQAASAVAVVVVTALASPTAEVAAPPHNEDAAVACMLSARTDVQGGCQSGADSAVRSAGSTDDAAGAGREDDPPRESTTGAVRGATTCKSREQSSGDNAAGATSGRHGAAGDGTNTGPSADDEAQAGHGSDSSDDPRGTKNEGTAAGGETDSKNEGQRKLGEDEQDQESEQEFQNEDSEDSAVETGGARVGRTELIRQDRGLAQYPADLINPNEWSLTLPTGKVGDPDTVEGDDLRTFSNEFFKLTPARDGIVFAANAGGVTTENSAYPRSELREMNGAEEAAWSNTSGIHVLDVCEAVTEVPPGKPEVVAAQIHDGSDDVLQIRLEDKTLAVQYADGEQSVVLDPAYRIGTPYRVRLVAEDSRVLVFYNGDQKADLPLSGDGWYYTLGAYVQSNPAKGGDAADALGEVVVHSVRLTHSASASAGSSGDGSESSSTAPPSPADTGRDDEAEARAEDDEPGAAAPNTSADDDRTSDVVTPRPGAHYGSGAAGDY